MTDSISYRLIVDLNGKKVKSLFFKDNNYKVGQNIDVINYKGHYYVDIN